MASGTSFSGKSQRLTMEHQRDQTILIVNHPRPQSAEKEPQCNCNVLLNDVILALELLPSSTTARATKTWSIFIHLTAKNVGLQYCPLAVRHINAYQAYVLWRSFITCQALTHFIESPPQQASEWHRRSHCTMLHWWTPCHPRRSHHIFPELTQICLHLSNFTQGCRLYSNDIINTQKS